MTATSVAHDTESAHDEHDHHPTDGHYVKIAIGLAVLTALEVAIAYLDIDGLLLIAPLMIIMGIKFVIVASQFMHLKFDHKMLSRIFYAGLLLAVAVYTVTLLTFHTFQKDACYDHVDSEECAR